MQFHMNGFRLGDPTVAKASDDHTGSDSSSKPEEADVLIVGCGPAGLTLAPFAGIKNSDPRSEAGLSSTRAGRWYRLPYHGNV
jgi:alkyl hydroperoxide reductase subunit AhpF